MSVVSGAWLLAKDCQLYTDTYMTIEDDCSANGGISRDNLNIIWEAPII
jgi:hypothetical protein